MIDVVVLTVEDWPLWRRLRLAALTEAPAAFGSTLAEWGGSGDTEARWRGRLAGVSLNLVLSVGGEPLGMVSAPVTGEQVELISLWVAPTGRGRGVGDEAVRQVVGWAHREHPDRPVVLSVMQDNEQARALYERHGFVDVGPSPSGVDERRMRLFTELPDAVARTPR